jgi:stage V sporulation protein SpoVS
MKHNSRSAGDIDGDGVTTLFFTDGREADVWTMQGVATGNPVSAMAVADQLLFDGGGQLIAAPALVDPGTDSNGDLMAGQNLQLTDVNGDGREELLFTIQPDHAGASGGEVVIMEYMGSGADNAIGNYTVTRGAANNLTSVEYIGAVAAGGPQGPSSTFLDMDGDLHSEIVLVGPGAANAAIQVFESDIEVPVELSILGTD